MSSNEAACFVPLTEFKKFYGRLIDTAKKSLSKFPEPYENNIVKDYDILSKCAYDTLTYLENKKGTSQASFESEKNMLLDNLTFYFTVAGPIVKTIKDKKEAEQREKRLAFEAMLAKHYPEKYAERVQQEMQLAPKAPTTGGKKKEKSKPRKKKVAIGTA
jgi:hypothetical protein